MSIKAAPSAEMAGYTQCFEWCPWVGRGQCGFCKGPTNFNRRLGLASHRIGFFVDGKPAPDLSHREVLLLPYEDNLNVCGIDEKAVQAAKDKAVTRLRHVGLTAREELEANTTSQSLGGYLIDGNIGQDPYS